jgi:hypothetical protein
MLIIKPAKLFVSDDDLYLSTFAEYSIIIIIIIIITTFYSSVLKHGYDQPAVH